VSAGEQSVSIRVQPRASRNQIDLRTDGTIAIKLTAPPVEGAANRALTEFLARTLGVPKSAVAIVSGSKSREKRIRVSGMSSQALRARLRELAG
jgi:uncharacterized protein (TIGR00251 family)